MKYLVSALKMWRNDLFCKKLCIKLILHERCCSEFVDRVSKMQSEDFPPIVLIISIFIFWNNFIIIYIVLCNKSNAELLNFSLTEQNVCYTSWDLKFSRWQVTLKSTDPPMQLHSFTPCKTTVVLYYLFAPSTVIAASVV